VRLFSFIRVFLENIIPSQNTELSEVRHN